MASITLKTIKRKTSVSRAKIREAVSAAYAKPLNTIKEPAVVKKDRKHIEQEYENSAKKKTRSIEFENIQRRNVFTYTAGNNVGREETIVITSPVGISTITVDMPAGGFVLFLDDLVIVPWPPPVIIG